MALNSQTCPQTDNTVRVMYDQSLFGYVPVMLYITGYLCVCLTFPCKAKL